MSKQNALKHMLLKHGWLTHKWDDENERQEHAEKLAKFIIELSGEEQEDKGEEEPGGSVKPLPKKLKEAHYSGLGLLLWFMHNSWKPKKLEEYTGHLDKTVEKIRRLKFSAIDFFATVCNGKKGNWYANRKTPWEIKNRKVDFNTWNEKWWERFDIFIKTLHKWDIEPSVLPFATKYIKWAFKHAKTGPMSFWGNEALAIQVKFVRRMIAVIQAFFGSDYVPWIKPNNELNHHGRNETGVMYAKWYVDFFDGIQDMFPEKDDVSKYVIDTTFCEWMLFPFAYDETKEFRGYRLGQGRFLRNGKRMIVAEHHVGDCLYKMKKQVPSWCGSAFPKRTPHRWHGDGGCGKDENENLIGKGPGFGRYHAGDNDQVFKGQKYLHSTAKRRRKSAIGVYFNLECLQRTVASRMVWMEHCKVDELEKVGGWKRAEAFIDGIIAGLKG